ncbi:MAG: haloacid dehalogenase-like hydrolase [Anaplasmataceae bacterium]|nr:haloacid dehalogenase-like hydrolase [Anaplasmataceae bacterium]
MIESIIKTLESQIADDSFAVFDFDNSCVVNDIQEAVLAYCIRHQLLKDKTLVQEYDLEEYHKKVLLHYYSLLDQQQTEAAYVYAIEIMAGFTKEEIFKITKEAIIEEGSEIGKQDLLGIEIGKGIKLREQVIELLNELQKRGVDIWVVTASFGEVVKNALSHFNIKAQCVGMRLEEQNGVYLKNVLKPYSTLEGKVTCIQKYINPTTPPLIGVGDSVNDLAMLEYANYKAVVNRGNKLTDIAREKGWFLI